MKKKHDPDEPESNPPEAPSVTCKNGAANQPLKRGQKVVTLTRRGLIYVLPVCHVDALTVSPRIS